MTAPSHPDGASLLDLLDRLIDKGTAVSGDITLSVADVDLVYVGLRLLVASADEVDLGRGLPPGAPGAPDSPSEAQPSVLTAETMRSSVMERPGEIEAAGTAGPQPPQSEPIIGPSLNPPDRSTPMPRINTDPSEVERGLCQLVLTIVELLRQLMERQAVRRMEKGNLTEAEVERLGLAFEQLAKRMEDLKRALDLDKADLNLDLGPLGKLI